MAQAASRDFTKGMPIRNAEDAGRKEVHAFDKMLDYVPCNVPKSSGLGKLIILEDNEPVIKMTMKRRWPQLRHVPRTHRIDLDWLFDRLNEDPGVRMSHIGTKLQQADMLTKGMFTEQQFNSLVSSCMMGLKLPDLTDKANISASMDLHADSSTSSQTVPEPPRTTTNKPTSTSRKRHRKR